MADADDVPDECESFDVWLSVEDVPVAPKRMERGDEPLYIATFFVVQL